MNVIEMWHSISGYESYYEVSNLGRVRSKDRNVSNGKGCYIKKGKVLKLSETSTGYLKIGLYKNRKRKEFKVHRLVARAFIPEIKGKDIINHIDGNPVNNRVDNLEWCTQSENAQHSYRNQLRKNNFNLYKERMLKEYTTSEVGIIELCDKYKCSYGAFKRYLDRKGIDIRSSATTRNIYKINRKELVDDFKKGLKNKCLAKKYKTNATLIATYRYKYKKGELII